MKESESIRLLTKAIPFRLSQIENSPSREHARVNCEAIREIVANICIAEGITPPAAQSTLTTKP